jgi:hypothetical protein
MRNLASAIDDMKVLSGSSQRRFLAPLHVDFRHVLSQRRNGARTRRQSPRGSWNAVLTNATALRDPAADTLNFAVTDLSFDGTLVIDYRFSVS